MSYGPQLPPHLLKIREASQSNVETEKSDDEKEEIVTYGPAIPANNELKSDENHETKSESIGPQLPPNFKKMWDLYHRMVIAIKSPEDKSR